MWREITQRALVVVLAVAVATAAVAHSVPAGDAHVAMSSDGMATDMPMHGKCSGCAGDEKGLASTSCSVYCGVVVALPAIAVAADAVATDVLAPSNQAILASLSIAPEPYPPRPTILS